MCSKCAPSPVLDPPLLPIYGPLPFTDTPQNAKYGLATATAYVRHFCAILQDIETSGHAEALKIHGNLYSLPSASEPCLYLTALLYPVWAAGDRQEALQGQDYKCDSCGEFVSHAFDRTHWENICGDCNYHTEATGAEETCQCCSDCSAYPCECCSICYKAPSHCYCCSDCECEECECESDDDEESGQTAYHYGQTSTPPWEDRSPDPVLPKNVPSMPDDAETKGFGIDPIQAAADFYLLTALSDMSRAKTAAVPAAVRAQYQDALEILAADRPVSSSNRILDQLYHDGRFAAAQHAARKLRAKLVADVAPIFLSYAISAVGGELRYHKAVSRGKALSSERGDAWQEFPSIVRNKGVSVLYDAVSLFEEFNSSHYGGKKWAAAAKVVAQYVAGDMPDWLFVDRMFTLQHNGGCFLDKAVWARKNGQNWGIAHMVSVLDAHASEDVNWALLLSVASPEVPTLFQAADQRLSTVLRRVGGSMEPVRPQKRKEAGRW